jgi:CRP-like cAMP-binding protein
VILPQQEKKRELIYKPAGSVIGELASLLSVPRTATVIAVERIKDVLIIPGEKLKALIKDSSRAKRLREAAKEMSSEDRLIDTFLRSLLYDHIYLHADQTQIAGIDNDKVETYEQLKDNNTLSNYLIENFDEAVTSIPKEDLPQTTIKTNKDQEVRLFSCGDKFSPESKVYIVKNGTIKLSNFPKGDGTITVGKGGIIGLEALVQANIHYYVAEISENSEVISIKASDFKRFAYSNKKIPHTNEAAPSLLYHLSAVLTARLKDLFAASKPLQVNSLSGLSRFKS